MSLECVACGTVLPPDWAKEVESARTPCESCGSVERVFPIAGNMPAQYGSLKIKHRRPGVSRPIQEVFTGKTKSDSGHLVEKFRSIDRGKDRYIEKVIDVETGEVWRDVDEPLSEHKSSR